jgi:hypothetical protein
VKPGQGALGAFRAAGQEEGTADPPVEDGKGRRRRPARRRSPVAGAPRAPFHPRSHSWTADVTAGPMRALLLAAATIAACATSSPRTNTAAVAHAHTAKGREPFVYVAGHFLVVRVKLDDHVETKFILDTGIGLEVISTSLCQRLSCTASGEFTGKRMSGQAVTMPLTTLPALESAGARAERVQAALFDFEANHFGPAPDIQGFLSLSFFRNRPFTIDYETSEVVLEDEASLAQRAEKGVVVPLRLDVQGPALDVFAPMRISGQATASIMIDTGSPALTLDERYLGALDIASKSPKLREVSGSDETGYVYVRRFLDGAVPLRPDVTPALADVPVKTMFQKIIHDGLVGDQFLREFVVTFDIPRARMILSPIKR